MPPILKDTPYKILCTNAGKHACIRRKGGAQPDSHLLVGVVLALFQILLNSDNVHRFLHDTTSGCHGNVDCHSTRANNAITGTVCSWLWFQLSLSWFGVVPSFRSGLPLYRMATESPGLPSGFRMPPSSTPFMEVAVTLNVNQEITRLEGA